MGSLSMERRNKKGRWEQRLVGSPLSIHVMLQKSLVWKGEEVLPKD